jgi:hypothetical protein
VTSKLRKFITLPPCYRLLLVRAWFLLGWYRAGIVLLSFKRLTASLRRHPLAVLPTALPAELRDKAVTTGYLVAVAARHTPWQSHCLPQVLVTQRLLANSDIPGQFYLGVRRGCPLMSDPAGLSAHAWLQCGEDIVNGAAGHEQFTVVSTFSWGGANRPAASHMMPARDPG